MKNISFLAPMAVTILLLTQFVKADDPPVMTDVEATIIGVDSRPLANADVEFFEIDNNFSPGPAAGHAVARTDDKGRVHFRWKAGASQMWVKVKDVGYGMCGITEFVPHVTARPAFPPLVAYGTISGLVPRELIGKVASIRFQNTGIDHIDRDTPVDGAGRFNLTDLMSGHWWLAATDAQKRILAERLVELNPGVHIQSVIFKLHTGQEATASTQPGDDRVKDPDDGKIVTWAGGTIRDAKDSAIAGAEVYAVVTYAGGMRMSEEDRQTVTDQNGHYKITGEGGLSMFTGVLVVHKKGFVPAMAWFDRPSPRDYYIGKVPATQPAGDLDVALADVGGTLDVRVVQGGKPAAGVSVVIRGAGADLGDKWVPPGHDDHPGIDEFLYPELITDAHGEAHFKLLAPDHYQVIATRPVDFNGEMHGARFFYGPFAEDGCEKAHTIADGVCVRNGEKQSLLLRISPHDCSMNFAFHKTDGKPFTGEVIFKSARGFQSNESNGMIKLDAEGGAGPTLGPAGLWRVETLSRQSPIGVYLPGAPPYDLARGVVAVSDYMKGTARPVFTARHYAPGTAEIQVKDVNGRPMQAVVELRFSSYSTAAAMGATDKTGFVRLEGVVESPLQLSARPIGIDTGDVIPLKADDAALRGRVFFPTQPALVKANQVTQLAIQQAPAGYVRGKLHPAPGTKANEFFVYAGEDGWQATYDPQTGEYMAGPFVAGKVTIRVNFKDFTKAAEQEVTVIGGDVVHADLTTVVADLHPQHANLMAGATGASSVSHEQEALGGKVLLSDGKTPAYGAVVNYIQPHEYQPSYTGQTDVHGTIHSPGVWRQREEPGVEPPGGPTEPVVMAFLPGACGAVIVPAPKMGRVLSLILPPPLSLRGKITVGGMDAQQQTGTIRVYAAYEGKEFLNRMLSLGATAQADGSYELAGLTPGTYRVQAALDDIWLSTPQTLEVKDQPPMAMNLDIGRPGAPVRVKVTDEHGAGLTGKSVIILGRTGPLAKTLWPDGFETDGAATAWIPTLESGKHTLLVGDVKKDIDVPELPAANAVDVRIIAKR
ncbi:MAG TPA: carboxypeptidase-like regulatory domain-containing protein [Tepidisphaeraceae bacterium]|nr:carboxypeptidase-like regulatory domain-containing protein [Tepidisphaeraceae bacterium]